MMPDEETCPECGEKAIDCCRCQIYVCKNGHEWQYGKFLPDSAHHKKNDYKAIYEEQLAKRKKEWSKKWRELGKES